MQLPRSQELAAELIWLDETASTNDALRELVVQNPMQPNRTVLVTNSQTSGRGRLGREWIAPPGKTLAVSILLRNRAPMSVSWLPLIAGSAVRRGLAKVLEVEGASGVALGVKWPNDVLAGGETGECRKVAGILSEMLPDGSVIVGIGINTGFTAAELPTDTSTSLTMLMTDDRVPETDDVLSAVLEALFALLDVVVAGDQRRITDVVTADSSTLGTQVRVLLPGGAVIEGIATRLTDDGALVITTRANVAGEAAEVVVAAGDIEHLR